MDAAAERAGDAQPPVTELVPEALDDDPLVRRKDARDLSFVVEIGQQILCRELVEVVRLAGSGVRHRAATRAARKVRFELADERAECAPELDGTTDCVALPEGELAGNARRGTDGHAVGTDLLDPPAARSEDDHVAMHPRAELVHHLLVELAHATSGRPRLAAHEDAEQATIWDRPTRGD